MGVEIEDNTERFLAALQLASQSAKEIIGGMAETYAKELCPPKWGAELKNSITHQVVDGRLEVGSNLEIAAYAELGTGRNYEPPPEWLANEVPKGTKVDAAGLSHWIYYDINEHVFKIGAPQVASPYLRPAFADHLEEYREVVQKEMENAKG